MHRTWETPTLIGQQPAKSVINRRAISDNKEEYILFELSVFPTTHILLKRPHSIKMAESLSFNNVTRQIAREDILNNQRRESFKSSKVLLVAQFHVSYRFGPVLCVSHGDHSSQAIETFACISMRCKSWDHQHFIRGSYLNKVFTNSPFGVRVTQIQTTHTCTMPCVITRNPQIS